MEPSRKNKAAERHSLSSRSPEIGSFGTQDSHPDCAVFTPQSEEGDFGPVGSGGVHSSRSANLARARAPNERPKSRNATS